MCGVQPKGRNRAMDLMLGLFNETVDQLVTASSVCLYGHVLKREDSCVMGRALRLNVKG